MLSRLVGRKEAPRRKGLGQILFNSIGSIDLEDN